jgi:hypothetical protein
MSLKRTLNYAALYPDRDDPDDTGELLAELDPVAGTMRLDWGEIDGMVEIGKVEAAIALLTALRADYRRMVGAGAGKEAGHDSAK